MSDNFTPPSGPHVIGPLAILKLARLADLTPGRKLDTTQLRFGRDAEGCYAFSTDSKILAVARWDAWIPTSPIAARQMHPSDPFHHCEFGIKALPIATIIRPTPVDCIEDDDPPPSLLGSVGGFFAEPNRIAFTKYHASGDRIFSIETQPVGEFPTQKIAEYAKLMRGEVTPAPKESLTSPAPVARDRFWFVPDFIKILIGINTPQIRPTPSPTPTAPRSPESFRMCPELQSKVWNLVRDIGGEAVRVRSVPCPDRIGQFLPVFEVERKKQGGDLGFHVWIMQMPLMEDSK